MSKYRMTIRMSAVGNLQALRDFLRRLAQDRGWTAHYMDEGAHNLRVYFEDGDGTTLENSVLLGVAPVIHVLASYLGQWSASINALVVMLEEPPA